MKDPLPTFPVAMPDHGVEMIFAWRRDELASGRDDLCKA